MYQRLSDAEEAIGNAIVKAAFKVHKELGPGLLEKIYEACFCHELKKLQIPHQRQITLPIFYDGQFFDEALRADVFVSEMVICELKAREEVNKLWHAQLISHLKLTKVRLGFLINFNVPLIKDGIKRFVN